MGTPLIVKPHAAGFTACGGAGLKATLWTKGQAGQAVGSHKNTEDLHTREPTPFERFGRAEVLAP